MAEMESNIQEKTSIEMEETNVAKKLMHMVKVVYFMLKKGISKGKLIMDLKFLMMKCHKKLNGKTVHNLISHHNHNWSSAFSAFSAITSAAHHHRRPHGDDQTPQFEIPLDEYEFSCSNSPAANSPAFQFPFHLKKRKKINEDYIAVRMAFEMLNSSGGKTPALPGFGKSPMVRQLRITDSPFPVRDVDDEDSHVDEAAQDFIEKFYKDMRRQNAMVE